MNFSLQEWKDNEAVRYRPAVFTTTNSSYLLYFLPTHYSTFETVCQQFFFFVHFLAVEQLFKQL